MAHEAGRRRSTFVPANFAARGCAPAAQRYLSRVAHGWSGAPKDVIVVQRVVLRRNVLTAGLIAGVPARLEQPLRFASRQT
jgi:hypothetical protein